MRDVRVEIMRGHDIQHRQLADLIRMIERHAAAHAAAAVMAHHAELVVAEMLHDLDAIQRHRRAWSNWSGCRRPAGLLESP